MTQIQLVNAVLRRLREAAIATVAASTYSKMVAELVNEAKRYVEDRWDWLHLRQTIVVTTVGDGTYKYTLTGAGDRYRLLRDHSTNPIGWDVINNTEDYNLWKAPSSAWMSRQLTSNSTQTGNPLYFDVNGQSGGDPQVDLWPIPGGGMDVNFNLVIPQDDFAVDGTDNNTELTVPDWPVILKAYALTLGERGEDGGTSSTKADAAAERALWDAIQLEMGHVPEENTASIG